MTEPQNFIVKYVGQAVYIASPYTSRSPSISKARAEKVSVVTAQLIKNGVFAFSPIAHGVKIDEWANIGTATWLHHGLQMLHMCGRMIVIPLEGWEKSFGVAAEIEYCKENMIKYEFMPLDVMDYFIGKAEHRK